MILFPITSPRCGLYFSPSRLCMADIHKTFREPRLVEYREHPIPVNCIELSSSQTNISNPDQLLKGLQALNPEQKRPKSVALCLPDICTRTGIFEFSELPKNKEEQKSLINWRLEKDLNVSPTKARVSYQIYAPPPGRPSSTVVPVYRVVATTIHHSIVESYETLCLQAGLVPMSIGVASLSVFNLCQTLIDTTISLVSQKVPLLPEQRILIYIADWGFTVLIYRDNSPAFIRIKPMRSSLLTQEASLMANRERASHHRGIEEEHEIQESQPETSGKDSNGQLAQTLANELIGTMQYYFDAHPGSAPAGTLIPVFLCGSFAPDTVLPEIANIIENGFQTGGEIEGIGIKAFPIAPTNGGLPNRSLFGLTSWTSNTLPTFGAAIASS